MVIGHRSLLIAIVGPTATGKSACAIEVARRRGGEVVNADSTLLYRGMDIGTDKPTPAQRLEVPHHLLDIIDPDEPYNVARYAAEATRAIDNILARGRLPIVVGGSGLYVRSIVSKLDLPLAEPDDALRAELAARAKREGPQALHAELASIDPESAARIAPRDAKRIIRAIEVCRRSGRPMSQTYKGPPPPTDRYDCHIFGLTCDRERLYRRIEARVDAQVRGGLIQEVERLVGRGYSPELPALQAIGYKEVIDYINGRIGFSQMVETIKRNTRRFAKRQFTWFKTDSRIVWIDIEQPPGPVETILRLLQDAGSMTNDRMTE